MMQDAENGVINTIVVKDQSRIGRDVVEVGLLKRTFDEYNVRFITAKTTLTSPTALILCRFSVT